MVGTILKHIFDFLRYILTMCEEIKKPICIYCKKIKNQYHWCIKSEMVKKFEERAKYGSRNYLKKDRSS
jgi:hypothetical protein